MDLTRLIQSKLNMGPTPTMMTEYTNTRGGRTTDSVGNLIIHALNPSINKKKDLYREYAKLSEFYLLKSLVRKVKSDVLHKYRKENEPLFSITTNNEDKDDETKEFLIKAYKKLRIENFISEMSPEFLSFGEYLIKVDANEDEIEDGYDQSSWRSVFVRGKLDRIVTSDDRIKGDKDQLVIFSLDPSISKMNIKHDKDDFYKSYLGSGIFTEGLIKLINNVKLLEALMPLISVLNIENRQLIYVRVPPMSDPGQAFKLALDYETMLNSVYSAKENISNDVEDILTKFGRYKVVPLFGDKGTLDPKEIARPAEVDIEKVKYYKQAIADSIPVPLSYVGLQGENQGSNAQAYPGFLKSCRSSIGFGVHDILFKYARAKGKLINKHDFKLVPVAIAGADELSALDLADGVNGLINNMSNTLTTASQILKDVPPGFDAKKYVGFLNSKFRPIVGMDLFDENAEFTNHKKEEVQQ